MTFQLEKIPIRGDGQKAKTRETGSASQEAGIAKKEEKIGGTCAARDRERREHGAHADCSKKPSVLYALPRGHKIPDPHQQGAIVWERIGRFREKNEAEAIVRGNDRVLLQTKGPRGGDRKLRQKNAQKNRDDDVHRSGGKTTASILLF